MAASGGSGSSGGGKGFSNRGADGRVQWSADPQALHDTAVSDRTDAALLAKLQQQRFDAQAPGRTFIPGGGGGMRGGDTEQLTGSGAPWGVVQDPLAQIAERIGQVRGREKFGQWSPAQNPFSRDVMLEETMPLQRLLDAQQTKAKLEQKILEEQLKQMRKAAKAPPTQSRIQTGSGGGWGGVLNLGNDIALPPPRRDGGNWNAREEPKREVVDPYKEVREAAIQAAKRYLSMPSPHKMRG